MTTADTGREPLTAAELAAWVRDAGRRLVALVADLDDDQLIGPRLATVNPLLWEVGHITWFQEVFVLRRALGEPPIVEHGDAIWDSAAIPHDTRWFLVLPSRERTVDYVAEVTRRVADRVCEEGASRQLRHIARYAVHHHDMHTEAVTYTRQTLGYPPPVLADTVLADTVLADTGPADTGPADTGPPREGPAAPAAGALPGDARVPGGVFPLGADRDEPFVHDNEKWLHPVRLAPFAIARAPVTQAEYAAFADDGGYARRELWSDDGWSWRTAAQATGPVYWRRTGSGWQRRNFDRWVPLEPNRPVCHVCWYEAQAYCRWAGRRLPTEAEWEAAAVGVSDGSGTLAPRRRRFPWGDGAPTADRANLDWAHLGTVDVAAYPGGDSAFGCRQLIGNVWEWTASDFLPYPNFEQDAYRDNSWPWFGSRKVLRGGAWATRSRFMRATVRNYFTPDRRDVFAGFRTAAPA